MKHLDEHTIELYILGSDLVKGQIGEIEAHLQECHGCRSLAEQMKVFYEKAESELEISHHILPDMTEAIVRKQADIELSSETFWSPVHYPEKNLLAKFWYFVYRHPIITGTGSFVFLAGFAMLLTLMLKSPTKDDNPSRARYKPEQDVLEVFNKDDEILWQIPQQTKYSRHHPDKAFQVTDINGDGKNEVVTSLPLLNEQITNINAIYVFSGSKKLLHEFDINIIREINYLGTKYYDKINPEYVLIDSVGERSEYEIFTTGSSARSPNVLTRMDRYGSILGQYWHFGIINGMISTDLNSDGKKEIIIYGRNDVGEVTREWFAFIAVLDPTKIIGNIESSASQGFGFTRSYAELFYLRLPHANIDKTVQNNISVEIGSTMESDSKLILDFWTTGIQNGKDDFEYLFSNSMKVLDVKSTSWTNIYYDSLANLGKVIGKIDQQYLDNLKNGVLYWDGKEWRKEVVQVKNDVTIVDE